MLPGSRPASKPSLELASLGVTATGHGRSAGASGSARTNASSGGGPGPGRMRSSGLICAAAASSVCCRASCRVADRSLLCSQMESTRRLRPGTASLIDRQHMLLTATRQVRHRECSRSSSAAASHTSACCPARMAVARTPSTQPQRTVLQCAGTPAGSGRRDSGALSSASVASSAGSNAFRAICVGQARQHRHALFSATCIALTRFVSVQHSGRGAPAGWPGWAGRSCARIQPPATAAGSACAWSPPGPLPAHQMIRDAGPECTNGSTPHHAPVQPP